MLYLSCIFIPYESEDTKMNSNVERWYSMKEICEHLGVSRDTVLIWIEKRDMPASKMGRLWKFKVSEVDEWMITKRINIQSREGDGNDV